MSNVMNFKTAHSIAAELELSDAVTCLVSKLRESRMNSIAWYVFAMFCEHPELQSMQISVDSFEEASFSGLGRTQVAVVSIKVTPDCMEFTIPENLVSAQVTGPGSHECFRTDPTFSELLNIYQQGDEDLAVFKLARLMDVDFEDPMRGYRTSISYK